MFNLNENNRIVMSQHPADIRIGVNGMCGHVRRVGLDPSNGDVAEIAVLGLGMEWGCDRCDCQWQPSFLCS